MSIENKAPSTLSPQTLSYMLKTKSVCHTEEELLTFTAFYNIENTRFFLKFG